ncbi:oligosaccharyltransferase complex subunit epsilon [Polyrhizophydium stewartii]|uniref:Dolichyl-diphosphooligosaccharide--protein glycosyltransferase subunit OST2 n=1 Tax=Polyrhizophydium stewartii TaxID=2732419 RepID=A0ABR4NE93_9FUNG|nr:Dolichyl-diphosphooligosaccharide-protein glycosyltransferase subunit dad1 [Polyrhizophydium stewartii]
MTKKPAGADAPPAEPAAADSPAKQRTSVTRTTVQTPTGTKTITTTTTTTTRSVPLAKGKAAAAAAAAAGTENPVARLVQSYLETTPQSLKLIDAYLVFVMATGIVQFVYVILAGTYPYNAFLSGFIASVGAFVLAANLRIQANPLNAAAFNISPERAFADFAFASVLLYAFALNFVG